MIYFTYPKFYHVCWNTPLYKAGIESGLVLGGISSKTAAIGGDVMARHCISPASERPRRKSCFGAAHRSVGLVSLLLAQLFLVDSFPRTAPCTLHLGQFVAAIRPLSTKAERHGDAAKGPRRPLLGPQPDPDREAVCRKPRQGQEEQRCCD